MHKFIILLYIFSLLLPGCFRGGAFNGAAENPVIADLESKAAQITSYAEDYRVKGMLIKRMYFQFERNGRPFYRFREELVRSGKRYVYIYNADGEHDYHYFPDEKKAYQCATNHSWNESNYADARKWHFDYSGGRIIGEKTVNGKDCYLVNLKTGTFAIWKERGIKIAKLSDGMDAHQTVYYDNLEFNISDDLFQIPEDVEVIEQKE